MSSRAARVYGFGDFRLDPGRRLLLRRDGTPISLKPKAYDTLAYLVERAGAFAQGPAQQRDVLRKIVPVGALRIRGTGQIPPNLLKICAFAKTAPNCPTLTPKIDGDRS
jgi:hypothetical protein